LCIKLAKPNFGRTLAREARFYEQLGREQSFEEVVTPRCFDFFTVPLNECFDVQGRPVSHIKPWENITIHQPQPDSNRTGREEDIQWRLPDDRLEDSQWRLPDDWPNHREYYEDGDGWKSGSSWDEWRYSPSDPLICTLVLEKLGKIYFCENIADTLATSISNMHELVHDLGSTGIMHKDLRYWNIVRATRDVVCPRHERVHRWQLIDFDIAKKI
ncbi:hypothetical protein BDN70DRAFT_780057, partial [Pholiota conissans]